MKSKYTGKQKGGYVHMIRTEATFDEAISILALGLRKKKVRVPMSLGQRERIYHAGKTHRLTAAEVLPPHPFAHLHALPEKEKRDALIAKYAEGKFKTRDLAKMFAVDSPTVKIWLWGEKHLFVGWTPERIAKHKKREAAYKRRAARYKRKREAIAAAKKDEP